MKATVTYLCGCEVTASIDQILPSCSLHGKPILKFIYEGKPITLQEAYRLALKNSVDSDKMIGSDTVFTSQPSLEKLLVKLEECGSIIKDLFEELVAIERRVRKLEITQIKLTKEVNDV